MTPDEIIEVIERLAWLADNGERPSRGELRDAEEAVEAVREMGEQTIGVQEAWKAAGGNPGIKATKQDLIDALKCLDEAVDEIDGNPPT